MLYASKRQEYRANMPKPVLKIQISVKQVLQDIRSGMDDEELMKKYNLSNRQVQRLFRKMIAEGLVSPLEMANRLCVTKSQVTEAIDQMKKAADELD
jgi:DNA-binding MarR family transcriptional regulator